MMTPYRSPTTIAGKNFNGKHCKLRNIVERCFGVLKNRFRCIIGSRGLHYTPAKVTQIINACCALHNICIYYKNNWPLTEYVETSEDDVDANFSGIVETSAVTIRDEICRNLC